VARDLKVLEKIEIATPCKADWNQMSGDERVRFCGLCRLNVYNLSGMSRADAEALVKKSEGKVCVRLFKRPDGTVLTQDCPIGIRIARKVRRSVAFAAATIAGALGLTAFFARPTNGESILVKPWERPVKPLPLMGRPAIPRPLPTPTPQVLMGEVSIVESTVPVMGKMRVK
jgi:hypothetical protein